ncbi:MAG: hypothetical protein U0401_16390 [Anaerolineae bacterium]
MAGRLPRRLLLEYLRQGMPVPLTQFLPTLPFDPEPGYAFLVAFAGCAVSSLTAVGLTYGWSRCWAGEERCWPPGSWPLNIPPGLTLSRVLGHDSPLASLCGSPYWRCASNMVQRGGITKKRAGDAGGG